MPGRALVLGGGGVTGIGWEIGVLTGLGRHGVMLADADVVVGTSAGSVVGVDLRAGGDLETLYCAQLRPPAGELAARLGPAVIARYAWAMLGVPDPAAARRRIGAMAVRARTGTETARRAVIESRLPVRDWPSGELRITAVDAASGEFTVFDAGCGVSVTDAVGASCAVPGVWPPVTIRGRRYVDGGMRSAANADLASGYGRVIIIAPLVQGFRHIEALPRQVRRLRRDGSRVLVISPDRAARRAIGRNPLDPGRRAAAARAGLAQGEIAAGPAAEVWTGPGDAAASGRGS